MGKISISSTLLIGELIMTVMETKDFKWDKKNRILSAAKSGGFPGVLKIRSSHTNIVIEFVQDDEAGVRNEFWDGEMMQYCSQESDIVVILSHPY
jgi:hypothetical protein